MTYMLVVILHDLSRLPALLSAWKRIGVPGVTILHSVGGDQAENWLRKIGLGGIGRLFEHEDVHQRTLISVISDETLLEKAISEADQVVDGFDRPHSGVLFALPVSHALGIRKRGYVLPTQNTLDASEADLLAKDRKIQVSQILKMMDLVAVQVQADAPLHKVVEAILTRPRVQVVCVVNREERLIGLIDIASLADTMFFEIFPEEYISEATDVEKVITYLQRSKVRTAEELMRPPAWVKGEDSLEKVFHVLHAEKLNGVPVIDDHYHIVGYINLLELMAFCLRDKGGNEAQA
ncbi:MAG TPA: CBS domain-containing protein [Anaerolineales bacterium]|nr:CBS domain-containing protein [Anaerolineales bacterium]